MKKMLRFSWVTVILSLSFVPMAVVAAHGLHIEYESGVYYDIRARFDNGEPLKNGQVTVYSPDQPEAPWTQGTTDEQGMYRFVPDPAKAGEWTLRIRQAGHGEIVTIPVQTNGAKPGNTGYTWSQILFMSACILWGAAGTMLYFKRRT